MELKDVTVKRDSLIDFPPEMNAYRRQSVEEGIDAASPKKVIRSCREVGLLDEAETRLALVMADDRNLTAHTYDEEFAQQIVTKIVEYDLLLRCWYEKMIK